ncbi:hypothetical protein B7P43_G06833 [Cryptotermes secundus]|uniref:MADF domain-containing protein n=2 Tax=Cryptotermes secundus TaxID=105785 RepID=A0A2J7QDJ3_9NEOP|nr:uncharacterized protein LOC117282611 isoform X2 [Cryptotermes secundus]XP_033608865.1 uncharacterized protein LOC117282611 isoform X2 [Cryptotermes secundus]PNF26649.1 hypothetical protein B7P43_G06833 [Cryptotermes secundus]
MTLLSDEGIEKLINGMEKRPALYNKTLKGYLDSNLKKKLLLEVYEAVLEDWDGKMGEQKVEAGKEIQDKWKGLRSSFSRELREQRHVKSGQPACKRSKYIYFDRLLFFLLPHTQPKSAATNLQEDEGGEGNEAVEDPAEVTPEPGSENIT